MKLDKHEARERDAFLKFSDKVSDAISKNRTAFLSVVALMVLGAAGFTAYNIYSNKRETQAQEALYEARKKFDPGLNSMFQEKKETAEPKLSDDSEKAFNSVIQDYQGTHASLVAAIELSQAFLDEQKAEPALKVFEKVRASPDSLVGALFTLQNAKVLGANGKCSEAVGVLEKIWSNKSVLKAIQTEARLRAGICYEQLSQLDKAKEMFTTASQDKGAAADTAKKYLRLMNGNNG